MSTIAVLGTLDSKGYEHSFLADRIRERGHEAFLMDAGSLDEPQVTPDFSRHDIMAKAGINPTTWADIQSRQDRGECVAAMAKAAPLALAQLAEEGRIHGVISLGGGGGTSIATAAMRALPVGFPKVMVSTLASGNTAPYLGTKDIVMVPSIVDVAGLNRISRLIFTRAAGAICGMVEAKVEPGDARPLIAASMFGNTTACVNIAKEILEKAGYEVLVFHATGAGGRNMESLIESGSFEGVLDITTTEWADELVGGILGAGPERLDAAAKVSVPAIVTPGCLDMVNFGEPATVPAKFKDRLFYHHNPQVTLMRTNSEESAALGCLLAKKVNAYRAPVTVLLPLKAISVISATGKPFHDATADQALFAAIKSTLRPEVELVEMDCGINDPAFAQACAQALLKNIALLKKNGISRF